MAGTKWGHEAKCLPFRDQGRQLLVTSDLVFHPPWPRSSFDTVSQPASVSDGQSGSEE